MRLLLSLALGCVLTFESASADVPWPDRIVLCSETGDVTTQDISRFLGKAFPERKPVAVITGREATATFDGYTIYSYVSDSGPTPETEGCMQNFPAVQDGIRSAIDEVRSKLATKPQSYSEVPLGGTLGPVQATSSYLYGDDWMMMISATVFSGYGLRRWYLPGLLQLDQDFCGEQGKCEISKRSPE